MTAKEKLCPYCAETIMDGAKKCKHCGERLTTQAKEEHIEPKGDHTAELDTIISEVKPFARAYFILYGVGTISVFILFYFISTTIFQIFQDFSENTGFQHTSNRRSFQE